jgi:hypothetical protein
MHVCMYAHFALLRRRLFQGKVFFKRFIPILMEIFFFLFDIKRPLKGLKNAHWKEASNYFYSFGVSKYPNCHLESNQPLCVYIHMFRILNTFYIERQ